MKAKLFLILIIFSSFSLIHIKAEISTTSDYQREYFAELGDAKDFTEGDNENLSGFATFSVSEGYINFTTCSCANDYISVYGSNFDGTLWNEFSFQVKANVTGYSVLLISSAGLGGAGVTSINITTEWQTVTWSNLDLDSDWQNPTTAIVLQFYKDSGNLDGTEVFSLDNLLLNGPIHYDAEFEERTNPYFWDSKDKVFVRGLSVGNLYGILIGSNQATSEQQWINFTAQEIRAKIWFRQSSAEYTNDTVKITQLFIQLYQFSSKYIENSTLVDTLALDIIYKDEQVDFGSITENIILLILYYMFLLALGGFTYAIVTSYKKYRNR